MWTKYIPSLLGYSNLSVLKTMQETSDIPFSKIMTERNKNMSLQGFNVIFVNIIMTSNNQVWIKSYSVCIMYVPMLYYWLKNQMPNSYSDKAYDRGDENSIHPSGANRNICTFKR